MKIGEAVPRFDALSKVTGQERYAADYYGANFLWVGVKRAGVPHARLTGIDADGARRVPGVVAVLTHEDVPGPNRQGTVRTDQPVLADRKIRYAGDAVALVLAESREAVKEALARVVIGSVPLPGVFDVEEALKAGATLVHEENPDGNLIRRVTVTKGEGEEGFKACDLVVESSFEVGRQEHAYLETEAGWAFVDESGILVIVASTQTPFRDRLEVGRALDLDPGKIRVIAPYLGGAFGGKDGLTVQALLAVAALNAGGRPVKMWWDREESFLAGVKRVPARMYYRLGARRDGTMTALDCTLYFDSGAYASLSGEIMTLAVEHAGGVYRIPHTRITGWCGYTNNPVGGPFRGFGVPQVTAAMEQMVDILAESLGMDPLLLRTRNAVEQGDENCLGVSLVRSTHVKECLRVIEEHPLWRARDEWKAAAGRFKRRGTGVAALSHAIGYPKVIPDVASAKIEVTREGRIRVYTGVSDLGQGNGSTYLQMAGHLFHQDAAHLELVLPDTARTLPCGSASASRCTYVFGNALLGAAAVLKQRLLEKAGLLLHADPARLILAPGRIVEREKGRDETLGRIAATMSDEERSATFTYTAPVASESSDIIYLGPHALFSYGAHLARIEVDELTGQVDVVDYVAVTEAGAVINPQAFDQQVHGGIAQGLGYALTEHFPVRYGKIETTNFATYTIPTSLDVPDMHSVHLQFAEATGPFGMKGVGEIGINGPLPAIANGLADALGRRVRVAPMTGERVLEALRHQQEAPSR